MTPPVKTRITSIGMMPARSSRPTNSPPPKKEEKHPNEHQADVVVPSHESCLSLPLLAMSHDKTSDAPGHAPKSGHKRFVHLLSQGRLYCTLARAARVPMWCGLISCQPSAIHGLSLWRYGWSTLSILASAMMVIWSYKY